MSSLTIMTGVQTGTTYKLARRPLSLGRDPSRDIQILDLKVSRKHAVIRMGDTHHMISPTKAKNRLMINEHEVDSETALNDGDVLRVGDTVLKFSDDFTPDSTNAVNHRKDAGPEARDANTII